MTDYSTKLDSLIKEFKLFLLVLLPILIGMTACKTTKPISELTDKDLIIKMKRGGCYGECPIYKLEIFEGGYTKLYGERFMEKLGVYDKILTKDQYKAIYKAFGKSGFNDFLDKYDARIPDVATITLWFRKDIELDFKQVKGANERPEEVKALQALLDELIKQEGWNQIEKPKDQAKEKEDTKVPKEIKSEILIKPRPGLMLPKWFAEMDKKYGVRVVNRIKDLWIVTYDQKRVDPDMMMIILKEDPDILSAEFNSEVKTRSEK